VEGRAPTWDDFEEVLALLQAADFAVIGESDWTADGLRSEWRELDLEHDAWVVELDGRIGAYAGIEDRDAGRLIADGYVHPELRERGLGSRLIELTERRAHEALRHQPDGIRVYLQNATLIGDACTPNLYAAHGYEAKRHQFRMVVELDAAPEIPTLPRVAIRLYRDPEEQRALYSTIEDSFSTGPYHRRSTFEQFAQRVFRNGFDPSLVWIAVDAGEIVGANICRWKTFGDWGWIGSLGVLPSHRRRGIGEALLRTAFAEFWRRGERRVALGVEADNADATRLYERAGMRVLYTIVIYEKELRAATGA